MPLPLCQWLGLGPRFWRFWRPPPPPVRGGGAGLCRTRPLDGAPAPCDTRPGPTLRLRPPPPAPPPRGPLCAPHTAAPRPTVRPRPQYCGPHCTSAPSHRRPRWGSRGFNSGGGSSLYKVPTYSTRAGAAPHAPGGARHGGGNRAVTSQPRTGQSASYGDVKSSYGGGRRVGQEGVRECQA